MTENMWQIALLPKQSDMNIMLLGSTGSGKSASANTIIGRDRGFLGFTEGFSSGAVTKVSQWASRELHLNGYKQTITVMDTVGLSNLDVKISEAQSQIVQMLNERVVDAFLLVIKLGDKFTTVESDVMRWIKDNFGAKALRRTIVLFSHGDELNQPIERYLHKSKPLWSIVNQCFGRYHVFDNRVNDPAQVSELLEMIKKIKMMNGDMRYTNQNYKVSQEALACKGWVIILVVVALALLMLSPWLGGGIVERIVRSVGEGLFVLAAGFGVYLFFSGEKD